MSRSNLILTIGMILVGIYGYIAQNSADDFQRKYIQEQAQTDTLKFENERYSKLAQPIMSNADVKLLESKFDGLEEALKEKNTQLLLANKTTLRYQTLYLKGQAQKDTVFVGEGVEQYKFSLVHNERTSVFGLFRTDGYYEVGVDQKPLVLEITYIKTDRGIKTIVKPNYSDVEVEGLESFYPFEQYYEKNSKKGLTFEYFSANFLFTNTVNYNLGFHFNYDGVFKPALFVGPSNIQIGVGMKFW